MWGADQGQREPTGLIWFNLFLQQGIESQRLAQDQDPKDKLIVEQFNSQFEPPGLFLVFEPLPYKNKPKTISCIQVVQEVKPGLVHEKLVFSS